MITKFVYSYSVKLHVRIQRTLRRHFLPSAGCGSIFSVNSSQEAWRNGCQLARGQVKWQMRQNFVVQFIQLFNCWLCNVGVGVFMEKNWVHSVDQSWLQALQFSVNLIDLLSILLRYNGFTWIHKAAMDQTSSRPPNSDHDLFLCKLDSGKCLQLLLGPTTELVVT